MEKYQPSKFWEERYQQFDLTRSGHADLPFAYNEWLYRLKLDKIRAAIRRHGIDPKAGGILELGCGTGVYVDMWKEMGAPALTGFDISSVPVERLREKHPGYAFHQEDLTDETLPLRHPAEAYRVVTAFSVLYHIVEDGLLRKALANIARLTAPGGYFLVMDVIVRGAGATHSYMKFRSLDSFSAMLAEAGFEVLERKPVYFTMVKAAGGLGPAKDRFYEGLYRRLHPYMHSRPDLAGRLLYWVDRALAAVLDDGPALQVMVCRKSAGSPKV